MKQVVEIERRVKRKSKSAAVLAQLQKAVAQSMKSGRGNGWSYKLPSTIQRPLEEDGRLLYTFKITYSTTSNRKGVDQKLPKILQRLAEALCAGPLKANPWVIVSPSGYGQVADAAKEDHAAKEEIKVKSNEPKRLGEVCLEQGDHFSRLFNREHQIRRMHSALSLGQKTGWGKRQHCLFDGPPGCGKTEILLGCAAMLGKEGEAWRWFDATSMTKAGAVEELITSPKVPPVLFVEEIEKCEESALRWLLGVMDSRGQVRRTNYRVGNQARNVRMIVLATANDVKALREMMHGALYSRFVNKIYCPRPDRDIMEMILKRDVAEIDGNPEWIEPALEFGFDKWKITDPRDVSNLCICGADGLLDGSAQKDYENTIHPEEAKRLNPTEAAKLPHVQSWESAAA